ncbi:Uncharacterised protein [Mycobacteroides abscessus subsp. abscessus]|nr:Uncharacterised protein [Mycobacteroides abscessus subsp. abscessus]
MTLTHTTLEKLCQNAEDDAVRVRRISTSTEHTSAMTPLIPDRLFPEGRMHDE